MFGFANSAVVDSGVNIPLERASPHHEFVLARNDPMQIPLDANAAARNLALANIGGGMLPGPAQAASQPLQLNRVHLVALLRVTLVVHLMVTKIMMIPMGMIPMTLQDLAPLGEIGTQVPEETLLMEMRTLLMWREDRETVLQAGLFADLTVK